MKRVDNNNIQTCYAFNPVILNYNSSEKQFSFYNKTTKYTQY